jgi:hypothetical protein
MFPVMLIKTLQHMILTKKLIIGWVEVPKLFVKNIIKKHINLHFLISLNEIEKKYKCKFLF